MFGLNDRLRAREAKHGPIRVAVIGAGAMGAPMIDQMTMAPGMTVDVVIDTNSERARRSLVDAGYAEADIVACATLAEAKAALAAGKVVHSGNAELAWGIERTDVVVEATGIPEVYAHVATATFKAKKHLVTLNVEGEVLIGHLIKKMADDAGVIYTGIHGDEPGVIKALYDEADALGFEILAAGRHDYGGGDPKWHKNNVHEYLSRVSAKTVHHNMAMYASFVDGSKPQEECCMIANALGLFPDVRGLHRPHVYYEDFAQHVPQLMDLRENGGVLDRTGVVEMVQQAEGPESQPVWCFVVVRIKNEVQRVFMTTMSGMGTIRSDWSRLGAGLAVRPPRNDQMTTGIFYTPYHYTAIQAPISVALAVVDGVSTIGPKGNTRYADMMSLAKKDLAVGEVIDEIGGVCICGRVEKASVVKEGNFLPFALAHKAKMIRPVRQGDYVRYDDVDLSDVSQVLIDLRRQQDAMFPPAV